MPIPFSNSIHSPLMIFVGLISDFTVLFVEKKDDDCWLATKHFYSDRRFFCFWKCHQPFLNAICDESDACDHDGGVMSFSLTAAMRWCDGLLLISTYRLLFEIEIDRFSSKKKKWGKTHFNLSFQLASTSFPTHRTAPNRTDRNFILIESITKPKKCLPDISFTSIKSWNIVAFNIWTVSGPFGWEIMAWSCRCCFDKYLLLMKFIRGLLSAIRSA